MAEARYQERVYERAERPAYDRSIPGILSDLLTQFTTLSRQEGELARTEVSEKISRAVMGIAMAGAAAVLLIPSLVILMMAGVYGITQATDWPLWVSALLVGGGFVLRGLIEDTLEQLRTRLRPGSLVEDALGFASDNGGGELVRSLGQQVSANPLP